VGREPASWDHGSIADSAGTIVYLVVGSMLVLSSSVLLVNPANVRGNFFQIRGAILSRVLRRHVTLGQKYFDRRGPWLFFMVVGLALVALGIAKLSELLTSLLVLGSTVRQQ